MHYQVFSEDCLEGMNKIPDGSVDMILTDLPFGITDCDFDRQLPFEPMWQQFWRVTKNNAAVVLFSQMPFGAELIMSQRKLFRYEWCWIKNHAVNFLNAKKMPLRAHENILVFYRQLPTYNPQFFFSTPYRRAGTKKGGAAWNPNNGQGWFDCVNESVDGRRYPIDVQQFNIPCSGGAGDKSHPTQKPTDLLEYLIKTYTNEGETVLDATMGSGSTGVACVNTGRNFIGFETEKKFYDIALKRISTAMDKQSQALF